MTNKTFNSKTSMLYTLDLSLVETEVDADQNQQNPNMNSKPKFKVAKTACSKAKASVQEIKVGDYTMLCYNNQLLKNP